MFKLAFLLAMITYTHAGVIAPVVPVHSVVGHHVVHPVAVSHSVVHPARIVTPVVHPARIVTPVVHPVPLVHAPVVPVVRHAPLIAIHH